jgi:hypothetical protein
MLPSLSRSVSRYTPSPRPPPSWTYPGSLVGLAAANLNEAASVKPESSISYSGLDALNAPDYRDGDRCSESRRISRDTGMSPAQLPLLAAALLYAFTPMLFGNCDSRGFGLGIASLT